MLPHDDASALVCPECQRRYAPGFIYCPVDGAELPGAQVKEFDGLDSQRTTQGPPLGVRGQLCSGRSRLFGGLIAAAILLMVIIVAGLWWSARPYELTVTFREVRPIEPGDRVFVGKSSIGSVIQVDSGAGLQNVRLRVDSEHVPEIIEGAKFFSLPEIPLVSPRGIHVYLPQGTARPIANRSRLEGETSAAEYLGLIAREKGLSGLSDFTSGLGELIIPSSHKRAGETQRR